MGYCTSYKLSIYQNRSGIPTDEIKKKIVEEAERLDILDYAFDEDLNRSDSIYWYEHNEHMKQISENIPDVIFKLHGEGEDNNDIWDKYYLNGKCQECYAEITIPEFDESKLS